MTNTVVKSAAAILAISVLGVAAFAATASAAETGYTHTRTLKRGARGLQVEALQEALNACGQDVGSADGVFGNMTLKAVKAFQKENGLAADGIVGRGTGSELEDCSMDEEETTGVETTTGGTTTEGTLTGPEGNLTSINKLGLYNNTKVNEGAKDVSVYAIEMTAKDGDQKIDGFNVAFKNTGSGSTRFTRVASEVSIWLDGKEIGRKAASAYSDDASDVYTYRFSGMNGIVKKDMKSQLVVAVSPVSTFDSADVTSDAWKVEAGTVAGVSVSGNANFISAMSANGRFRDFGSDTAESTLDFQKATGEATWKVTSSATNPVAKTIQVSKTADKTDVTLLAFDVKAENAGMLLQKLPIEVTVASATPATSAQTVIKTLKLYVDGNLVTSESAPSALSGAVVFGNSTKLQKAIASNATVKVEVRADLASRGVSNTTPSYAEGTTIKASYVAPSTCTALATPSPVCTGTYNATTLPNPTALSVELDNTNRDTVTNMTGSATGELQTLRTTGALVTMGTTTQVFSPMAATGASANRATYTIPVTVKAFDDTLYIGQSAQYAATVTGTNAFSFGFNDSTAPAALVTATNPVTGATVTQTVSSNATVQGSAWRVDAGSEKTFTITVVAQGATADANLRVLLNDIKYFTDSALTAGATTQTLSPSSSFQTGYVQVK